MPAAVRTPPEALMPRKRSATPAFVSSAVGIVLVLVGLLELRVWAPTSGNLWPFHTTAITFTALLSIFPSIYGAWASARRFAANRVLASFGIALGLTGFGLYFILVLFVLAHAFRGL
jgi:hypothetical protein